MCVVFDAYASTSSLYDHGPDYSYPLDFDKMQGVLCDHTCLLLALAGVLDVVSPSRKQVIDTFPTDVASRHDFLLERRLEQSRKSSVQLRSKYLHINQHKCHMLSSICIYRGNASRGLSRKCR